MKVLFPNDKQYEVAPLSMSEAGCRFFLLIEEISENSGKMAKIGSFLITIKDALIESLRENHSDEEVTEALRSIRLNLKDPKMMALIKSLQAAFTGFDDEAADQSA